MAGTRIDEVEYPVLDWEIEFSSNNFNEIFNKPDWESWCNTHIANDRLQLAMNQAQTCGMIEIGRYQEAVQAAKQQGMKEKVDFHVESPTSYLVMGQSDRFMLYDKDRRERLMTLLAQAREQKLAREQLQRLMKSHALKEAKKKRQASS